MPANVNSGAPCSQPRAGPAAARTFGIIAMLRWRTSTPFGNPVVPDVYMMSAMSSASTGTWNSLASRSRSRRPTRVASPPLAVGGHDRSQRRDARRVRLRVCSSSRAHVKIAEISAWPRIVTSSGAESRVLAGTITAPALWTAGVRRRSSAGSTRSACTIATRSPLVTPLADQPARGLVRLLVPLRET